MIRSLMRTSLVAVCFTLTAILAAAQDVKVDYDRDVDFSKINTYTWRAAPPSANPLIDKRIVEAIDTQLAAKGWTKVDSSPNVFLTYRTGIDGRRRLNVWGSGPRWNGIGTATEERIYTGQLVVDISDATSEQLIWRGQASDTMSDKQEKNEKRMNEAIAKLFKQFPPAPAASRSTR